jgi:oxygen-independent coproporphyrinogen-3 oxidase
VLAETRARAERLDIRPETIFFGGGTPSALSPSELDALVAGLRSILDLSSVKEWSIEINPATVSPKKARLLFDLGIRRASVGIQSWRDAELKTLGRIHTADQARRTLDTLRDAGFEAIGADLMFAIPGQSADSWADSMDRTIRAGVRHISAYCLTYEEGTDYFLGLERGDLVRDETAEADFLEMAIDRFTAAGFAHYEISNYALPGFESEHNRAYWSGREYLGIGPGAFSTVGGHRWKNRADTSTYIAESLAGLPGADFEETLSPETLAVERAAFGIRMAEGCRADELFPWRDEMGRLIEDGLLERAGDRVRLTRRGKLLADAVAEGFVG